MSRNYDKCDGNIRHDVASRQWREELEITQEIYKLDTAKINSVDRKL